MSIAEITPFLLNHSSTNFHSNFPAKKFQTNNGRKHFDDKYQRNPHREKVFCIFCDGSDYNKPQNYPVITDPRERKRNLLSKGLCFVCLRSGHQSRSCGKDINCFNCRKNHHVAICFYESSHKPVDKNFTYDQKSFHANVANPSEGSGINLFKSNNVLLQTARAQVSSVDEKNCQNLRILFDLGSQLSYISPKACEKLNLKTIYKKDISIKVFGKHHTKKSLDCVKLAIKSKNTDMNIYVDAFVNPVCYPVEGQKVNLVTSTYPHLVGLDLADSNPENCALDIDILIGGDFYWQFFNSQIVKGKSGPVAMSSKLGYVLSSLVESCVTDVSHSNVVNTTVLKVQAEFITDREDIKTSFELFCEFKNGDIDKSVIDEFEENINFKECRYEVGLPFKENHDELHDHYSASVNRLKKLTEKTFRGNPELLKEYDRIINE